MGEPRKSLTEMVVDGILEGIFSGAYGDNDVLPPELVLAEEYSVSRAVIREAVKALRSANIVSVHRGVGTFINPASVWSSLEMVLRYTLRTSKDGTGAVALIEVRRIVETGAAALAAAHCTPQILAQLEEKIEAMETASAEDEVAMFVAADIEFHDIIFRASLNPLIPVLFEPLRKLLQENRFRTSSVPEIQRNAIRKHRQVLAALATGDAEASRIAMSRHIEQTADDLRYYVLRQAPTSRES